MKDIEVSKTTLRERVQTNRDAHQAIFEEAVSGYREQAIAALEGHVHAIRAGKVGQVSVFLPMPENHTSDYDRILAMIEMDVAETITLNERDFASYVMDDWDWKREFLTANSAYSATARSSLS